MEGVDKESTKKEVEIDCGEPILFQNRRNQRGPKEVVESRGTRGRKLHQRRHFWGRGK